MLTALAVTAWLDYGVRQRPADPNAPRFPLIRRLG
jgi:hypothetical protein